MSDFSIALDDFMTAHELSNAGLGKMLSPEVSYSAVRKWRIGETEPAREHRRQLIKLSKGKITPKHFT